MDPTTILQSGGLIVLGLMVFAESGLMVGFFLPGDTLLISAGVLAAEGQLPVALVVVIVAVAAIVGDNTGYQLGRVAGRRLFQKKDGILFRHEHVVRAERFYEKYGSKTMLLSHFIPIVRSFAPLVAGVGKMPWRQFFLFDAVGDIVWAVLIVLLGYWVGSKIPHLDHYILPTFLAIAALSFGPTLWQLYKNRDKLLARLRRDKQQ